MMIIKLNYYMLFFQNQHKCYNEQTKWMYFLVEDDDLLGKYNTIYDKGSADIK